MNKNEAQILIGEILSKYRKKDYLTLKRLIETEIKTGEIIGKSGTEYHYEIQLFWDDKKNGNIRVMVNIDDGGLRVFRPLSNDFIKSSNNTFIGE